MRSFSFSPWKLLTAFFEVDEVDFPSVACHQPFPRLRYTTLPRQRCACRLHYVCYATKGRCVLAFQLWKCRKGEKRTSCPPPLSWANFPRDLKGDSVVNRSLALVLLCSVFPDLGWPVWGKDEKCQKWVSQKCYWYVGVVSRGKRRCVTPVLNCISFN